MKRMVPFLALTCVAATCNGDLAQGVSSDFRVDLAGELDNVDSHSTRMCVAPDGAVYVVWVDDRTGTPNVWMNRKLPQGERDQDWLPAAVQVNQFGDSNVWNPDVACDANGLVYIVWEDDRDGEVESHQIYAQVSNTQGASWLPEDRLLEQDPDGRSNSFNPRIVTADPKVYVVWSDNINGAFDILMAQSYNRGIEWETTPVRIESDDPGEAWSAFPQITLNGSENVYITWEDFRGGGAGIASGSDVYFSKSFDGGINFSEDKRLDITDGDGMHNSFVPKIANDGNNVYVVWHDDRNGEANDVYMAYSADGGNTWSQDQRANSNQAGLFQSLYPDVCVSGNVGHVGWHDAREGGFFRAFYNRAMAGNWAGAEFRLDPYKSEGQRGSTQVSMACAGDLIAAAWLDEIADEQDFGFNDIHYNYSEDGGQTWADNEDLRVDSIGEGTAFKTDVNFEIAADGTIRAAWTDGRNGTTDVFYQQFPAGTEMDALLVVPRE
ncbi:MAG: sialidase family protein [Myxococcota bacterium]